MRPPRSRRSLLRQMTLTIFQRADRHADHVCDVIIWHKDLAVKRTPRRPAAREIAARGSGDDLNASSSSGIAPKNGKDSIAVRHSPLGGENEAARRQQRVASTEKQLDTGSFSGYGPARN